MLGLRRRLITFTQEMIMVQKQIHIFNKLMATVLILFSLQVHAMEVDQELEMQSIDEIPEYCAKLVEYYADQSEVAGSEEHDFLRKTLPFKDREMGNIALYLGNFLDEDKLPFYILRDCFDTQEIALFWHQKHSTYPFDAKVLQSRYAGYIQGVQRGWDELDSEGLELKRYLSKDSLFGQSQIREYRFFLKKQVLLREGEVIESLAKTFGLEDQINSIPMSANGGEDGFVYLRVKKNAMAQVKSIFNCITTENWEACKKLAARRLVSLLMQDGEKNGRKEKEDLACGPFPKDMANKIAKFRYHCQDN